MLTKQNEGESFREITVNVYEMYKKQLLNMFAANRTSFINPQKENY